VSVLVLANVPVSATYLHDGLLDSDTNTLAVHTLAGVAHEAELKVDADLLASALGELVRLAGDP
jgi:hypothetical protein